jgi:succinate dehydrogenase/fumarate reductase cytochrome b subunit
MGLYNNQKLLCYLVNKNTSYTWGNIVDHIFKKSLCECLCLCVCVCVCVHICTGVRISLKNPIRKHLRAGEMALQLRGLATKSESLSLIPRTHV